MVKEVVSSVAAEVCAPSSGAAKPAEGSSLGMTKGEAGASASALSALAES